MGFICNWLNEIIILSDGNVTTCCLDAKGENSYGNIYKHSLEEIIDRFISNRKMLIKNPGLLPLCEKCYKAYSKKDNGQVGTFNVRLDPSDEEIKRYLDDGEENSRNFVIEPSGNCSLKCIGCIHSIVDMKQYRKKMFLDLDYLQSWYEPHPHHVKNIRYFNYGETLLHPKSVDFCTSFKQSNPESHIILATNGMPLTSHEKREKLIQSGFDAIYFSIHGSCQDSVQRYMTDRFNFQDMMGILSDLASIKAELNLARPELVWKYILFEWNDTDHHVNRAKELASQIGIDTILFTLTSAPSPSKRFTSDSEEWKIFTKDMTFFMGFCGFVEMSSRCF